MCIIAVFACRHYDGKTLYMFTKAPRYGSYFLVFFFLFIPHFGSGIIVGAAAMIPLHLGSTFHLRDCDKSMVFYTHCPMI